jgi:hypothetical protein
VHQVRQVARQPELMRVYAPQVEDAQVLINGLQALATGTPAHVRKVVRAVGHQAVLWAPVLVEDETLDVGDAHASDAERMAAAVRRACGRHGLPAVSRRRVQDEVELDPRLRPAGTATVASALADTGKGAAPDREDARERRVRLVVVHVGRIGGEAFYAAPEAEPRSAAWERGVTAARAYVRLGQLEERWRALDADGRVERGDQGPLPTVTLGRALWTEAQVGGMIREADALLAQRELDPATRRQARVVRNHMGATQAWVADHVARCRRRLALHVGGVPDDLPAEVDLSVPGWTAEEVQAVIAPLHPTVAAHERATRLVPLLSKAVRRVPNPRFEHRGVGGLPGAEFLFDRTDVLLYAAKQWGGSECVLQAALAEACLGDFRDARFVVPALRERDPQRRLTAVACLAYLCRPDDTEPSRTAATMDPNGSVRAAALWAYGFANGEGAVQLLEQAADDTHPRVRALRDRARVLSPLSWWRL